MGFAGMLCIHPAQVAVIHSVFAPSQADLDWAKRVATIAAQTGSSAFQLDGKMIDAPVIERGRRMLATQVTAGSNGWANGRKEVGKSGVEGRRVEEGEVLGGSVYLK